MHIYDIHYYAKALAMDGQWRRSRFASVTTDSVLNKHEARSVNTLIKTKIGPWYIYSEAIHIYSEVMKTIQCAYM